MSRKRPIFDVELPDEVEADPAAPAAAHRRSPMAAAVRETADSLRARGETEARIRAENDALAHEHVRLKRAGLVLDMVPTDRVEADKLIRDRAPGPDADLAELKASILAIGLSNPIRVEARADGRYELIQGWRRLRAFIELEGEHRDGRFTHIPAGIVGPGDAIRTSYRRMVDENMVRKDVSFAEMARLAQAYAADAATGCPDVDAAVTALFGSAGYQKRSYIRAFAELLDRIGDALAHPQALGRNLGLDIRRALETDPAAERRLRAALAGAPGRDAAEEAALLRAALGTGARPAAASPADQDDAPKPRPQRARARTTLRLATSYGEMRCVATDGRLELLGPTDFAAVDPRRLETAVAGLLGALRGEPGPG
jgi:ParB family chromosome partitioning protein